MVNYDITYNCLLNVISFNNSSWIALFCMFIITCIYNDDNFIYEFVTMKKKNLTSIKHQVLYLNYNYFCFHSM